MVQQKKEKQINTSSKVGFTHLSLYLKEFYKHKNVAEVVPKYFEVKLYF